MKELNPTWEYRLYDDQDMLDFIKEHYGSRVLEYYCRINPTYGAARADLFRYLLIYKVGGVYLDIKSSINRPLDEVLKADDRYLLAHWSNKAGEEFEGFGMYPELSALIDGEFQQWHIAAVSGHPFLRLVIQRVLKNILRYNPVLHDTGRLGVRRLTGPIPYTLAILSELNLHNYRMVGCNERIGFDYSIYRRLDPPLKSAHRELFKAHYTELTEPIVNLTNSDKFLTSILNLLLAARNIF